MGNLLKGGGPIDDVATITGSTRQGDQYPGPPASYQVSSILDDLNHNRHATQLRTLTIYSIPLFYSTA
jgi:hypothetical protein